MRLFWQVLEEAMWGVIAITNLLPDTPGVIRFRKEKLNPFHDELSRRAGYVVIEIPLETPVTIGPGETAQFVLSIECEEHEDTDAG